MAQCATVEPGDDNPTVRSKWRVADVDKWKRYFGVYQKRALDPKAGEKARDENRQRANCYRNMLEAVGVRAEFDTHSGKAVFTQVNPLFSAKDWKADRHIERELEDLRRLKGNHKHRLEEASW